MPYCTGCGSEVADTARFCARCGNPMNGAAAPPPASFTPAVVEPLDYTIQGDNLQVARLRLKPGQEVFAEAGKMLYKTPPVSWESRMSGDTLGQKIWGAFKRKLMGESLFWTYFRASSAGVPWSGIRPRSIT